MRSSGTHTRLVAMLRDSIALLCKSSLLYEKELSVEGLLGITLDGSDIVLVNISQIFHPLDNNDDHVDGGHKRSSSREGSKAKVAQSHRSPSPVEKKNRVSPMERSRRSSPEDQSRKSPPQATTATSPAHDDTPAQSIKLDYDCIVIKDEKDIKTEVEDATDCFAALSDSHAMDHDVAMSAMDAAQDICGLPTTNTSTLTQQFNPASHQLSEVGMKTETSVPSRQWPTNSGEGLWESIDSNSATWDCIASVEGGQSNTNMAELDPGGYPTDDIPNSSYNPELAHTRMASSWPEKFRLPSELFDTAVRQSLAHQIPLTRSVKTSFITVLYHQMQKYTLYPTPAQYREVAKLIVTQYPYLRDRTPGASGYDNWYSTLVDKFKNARRYMRKAYMRKAFYVMDRQ